MALWRVLVYIQVARLRLADLVCLETELCISTEEISSVVFIVTDSFS